MVISHARSILAAAVCLVLPACGGLSMDPPEGFLVLDREVETEDEELRVVSADGARIWIREFADKDGGSLAFWADALEHDFVARRGYELVSRTPMEDGAGREGVAQKYSTRADGTQHGYLIAVWVFGSGSSTEIRVAEFTAPTEQFEAHLESVETAFETLR